MVLCLLSGHACQDARAAGVDQRKLNVLAGWSEAAALFSDCEKLPLLAPEPSP